MQAKLNVTIEFLDGRPNMEVQMGADYPAGAEVQACLKLLAQINMTGGIMEFLPNGLALIPMSSIKKITIEAPAIQGADALDLANLTMPKGR